MLTILGKNYNRIKISYIKNQKQIYTVYTIHYYLYIFIITVVPNKYLMGKICWLLKLKHTKYT